jgi:flagellar biosynthetic protein FliQ
MNAEMVLTIGQEALWTILLVSAPLLGITMIVGLLVSLFQAITQIHEATLAFVPKLLVALAVLAWAGPWMIGVLVDYIRRTIEMIPSIAL